MRLELAGFLPPPRGASCLPPTPPSPSYVCMHACMYFNRPKAQTRGNTGGGPSRDDPGWHSDPPVPLATLAHVPCCMFENSILCVMFERLNTVSGHICVQTSVFDRRLNIKTETLCLQLRSLLMSPDLSLDIRKRSRIFPPELSTQNTQPHAPCRAHLPHSPRLPSSRHVRYCPCSHAHISHLGHEEPALARVRPEGVSGGERGASRRSGCDREA